MPWSLPGTALQWSCSARTDCVDEELLDLMVRAGCEGIFFGVETGSPRMQKIIDKHLDIERAHEIIDAVERLGIRSTISLIVGFPEETWEDVRHSMRMFMHSTRCPKSYSAIECSGPFGCDSALLKAQRRTHPGRSLLSHVASGPPAERSGFGAGAETP